MRILVVEDEFLIAMALEDTLLQLGCDIAGPYTDLAAACRAAREEPVDGALLDINLKGESAVPAAEILLDRGINVVFCSGYVDPGLLPARLQACPRLPKPYSEAQLRAVIATHFGGDGLSVGKIDGGAPG